MFSVGTNNTIGSILDVYEGTSNVNNSYCSHAEGNGNNISGITIMPKAGGIQCKVLILLMPKEVQIL